MSSKRTGATAHNQKVIIIHYHPFSTSPTMIHHSLLSQAVVGAAATSIIKHQPSTIPTTITINYIHIAYIIYAHSTYIYIYILIQILHHPRLQHSYGSSISPGQSQCCCCGSWPCAARAREVLEGWGLKRTTNEGAKHATSQRDR